MFRSNGPIIVISLLLGALSIFLFTGWYNIIPWSMALMLLGYLSPSRKGSLKSGAVFGYFLFFGYILVGYRGKLDASSLARFSLLLIGFSLLGAICGMAGAFLGHIFRRPQ